MRVSDVVLVAAVSSLHLEEMSIWGTLSPGLCCTPLKSPRSSPKCPTPPPAVSICEMHADPMTHLTPHLPLGLAPRAVSIPRPSKEAGKPSSSTPADTAFCPVGPPTEQTPAHKPCPSRPQAAQGRGLDPLLTWAPFLTQELRLPALHLPLPVTQPCSAVLSGCQIAFKDTEHHKTHFRKIRSLNSI